MEVTGKPTVKKLLFEASYKGLELEKYPALLEELQELVNFQQLEATYPLETLQKYSDIVLKRFYRHLSQDKAYYEAGRRSFTGFYKGTVVGGIMLTAIKLMNPVRLTNLGSRLFTDSGLGEAKVESLDKTRMRVTYRGFPLSPHFAAGILCEGVITAGYPNVRYEIEKTYPTITSLQNFDIIYSWDEKA
jgi:uncharacterized protein (TIGR02265 family)